jgi:hypothetical protein
VTASVRTDANTRGMKLFTYTGANSYDGGVATVGAAAYSMGTPAGPGNTGYRQIWEQNPSTNAAWTLAQINGGNSEFGVLVFS